MEVAVIASIAAVILLIIIFSLSSKLNTAKMQAQHLQAKTEQLKSETDSIVQQLQELREEQFSQNLANQALVQELYTRNAQLKKQLAFFTEIENDSHNLNDSAAPVPPSNENMPVENNATPHNIGSDKPSENLTLDAEQQRALELMENTHRNILITGKAGTGKSFLLKKFVENTRKHTLVLAPTGIAALQINGVTLHRAFGFYNLQKSLEALCDTYTQPHRRYSLNSNKKRALQMAQTIIIDEVSMVRADTLEKINVLLQLVTGIYLPFGGKQMILFGDLFQLPPITKPEEDRYLNDRFGGKYFFCADCYREKPFEFMELTVNHRQQGDALFYHLLSLVRNNSATAEDIALLNTRVVKDDEQLRRVVRLFPTRTAAERTNAEELEKIPAKEYVFNAEVIYNKYPDESKNVNLNFPIVMQLQLKLGALVMFVRNAESGAWVNGTLGIVSKIDEKNIFVTVDGYSHQVHRETFEEMEAVYENGAIQYRTVLAISQFPLVPAYAMTIHKSQGMTYKQVACDITSCFATGQAYVALSRCTSLSGLHLLKPIAAADIKVDSEIVKFYQTYTNASN